MLCGIEHIPRSIPTYSPHSKRDYVGILRGICSVPHNIVMDLINIMESEKMRTY